MRFSSSDRVIVGCFVLFTIFILFLYHGHVFTLLQDSEYPDEEGFLPGLTYLRRNSASFSLIGVDLNQMSDDQLLLTLHSYLDNANTLCRRKLRLGNLGDGGWEVCDDPEIRPQPPCTIYSFGINNDFSFDDEMARVYGCHVYCFDPSMKQETYNRSQRVHFYQIGLSGITGVNEKKWPVYTFKDIRTRLGHENAKIDIIKMDIEYSEWPSLPNMLETNQLETVKQLLVEIHVKRLVRREHILPSLITLQKIEENGFMKFYVHKNEHCNNEVKVYPTVRSTCYEMHYRKDV